MPLMALLLFLAALLPTLDLGALMEVDELIYARVAQVAARDGHWLPLRWGDALWSEKPPLLLWLAAATAKLSTAYYAAWPYRLWSCLGAALCVSALARLAGAPQAPARAGQARSQAAQEGAIPSPACVAQAGALASFFSCALYALLGDTILHARFFTMDAAMLGLFLWATAFALEGKGARAVWLLAAAVWIKSWFVVAMLPALLLPLWLRSERTLALRLALATFLSLAAVTALYVLAYGPDFLRQELSWNILDRARGLSNERAGSNLAFYGIWASRSASPLIPLALVAPAALLTAAPTLRAGVELFAATLALLWLALLCLIKAQVINYLLPLEAALALCAGLWLCQPEAGRRAGVRLASFVLALFSALGWIPALLSLLASSLLALFLFWEANPREAELKPQPLGLAARLLALLILALLAFREIRYLRKPQDFYGPLAKALLANPARFPGEPLAYVGPETQAVHFYSQYRVQRLDTVPVHKPRPATLIWDKNSLVFHPAEERR